MRATKKPITIEYYPCENEFLEQILKWSTKERPIMPLNQNFMDDLVLEITTLEGVHIGTNKDVIIKGINGEVYPCKKSIFEKTYTIKK